MKHEEEKGTFRFVLFLVLSATVVDRVEGYGQVILAYYSGIGLDSVGSGRLNSISLAFFSPRAMTSQNCNFNDLASPCLAPAAGAGPSLGVKWVMETINSSLSQLKQNTASKPIVFIAFGGQSEGGGSWDRIFGDSSSAQQFAQNCIKLVTTLSSYYNGELFIGIDLDIEGTSTSLPLFPTFIKTFRSGANFNEFPVMIDALSGMALNGSSDHFKLSIIQSYGPSFGGINFVNFMVNNVQSSCDDMKVYWLSSNLDFLDYQNRLFGFWGENLAAWILKNPGCTDGSNPLFPLMKSKGIGMGIWQWWAGGTGDITAIIEQVQQ